MKKTFLLIILALSMIFTACAGASGDTTEPKDTTTVYDGTTTAEKTPDKEPEVTELKINVGSYNVKHFDLVSHKFSVIADDIRSRNLEILGLQEIDSKTTRSGGKDEPKLIAEELGWNYVFSKSIDYQGGAYGHCIISKYPIKSFVSKQLPGTGEKRSFGHAIIDVNGFELNFINTHLSHESKESRVDQFKTLANYVKDLDNFIIVGDFNTEDFTEFAVIENSKLLNNSKNKVATFPASAPKSAIDNFVVSNNIDLGTARVLLNEHSDHVMLFTTVTVKLNEEKK